MIEQLKENEIASIKKIYKESTPEGDGAVNPISYYELQNGNTAIVTETKRNENEKCMLQSEFEHNNSKIYIYVVKAESI